MGMAAAVVGAGVLGAGASVYASGKASKASQKATDAQIAAEKEQAAAAAARLDPYVQSGYQGNNALLSRLGLQPVTYPGQAAPPTAQPQTNALAPGYTPPPGVVAPAAPSRLNAPLAGTTGIARPDAPTTFGPMDPYTSDTFQGTRTTPGASPQQGLALLGAGKTGMAGTSPATPDTGLVGPGYSDTPGAVVDPNYTGPTGFGGDTRNAVQGGAPGVVDPNGTGVAQAMPTAAPAPAPAPMDRATASPADLAGNPYSYGNAGDPTFTDAGYTAPSPFHYTQQDYTASPGYQYQVDQAMKGVLANSAATGALKSGAALKALSDRAQNIALQDFGNERNFAYGQYNNDRNFGRATYDTNRAFDYGKYTDARDYLTGQANTQTNNLFNLTTMGANAAAGVNQSGQNATNGIVNALGTNATNKGNAIIAGANATTSLLGSGVNALAYGGGYGRGAPTPIGGTMPASLNGLY